ncbi:hypothetical protein [Bacillus nakamurai]|uniref:hypothetical protein n=1 Tax=Bacillus nakamurai TaxID=1793963 RepID=UPI002DD8486F|nr:hypothetical protein [Bacillus nakamurai]
MANAVDAIKTKRDINKMKNALHGRDQMMFILGVSLGLRISDLLTLKNGDLRGQTHLKLREGKTGRYVQSSYRKRFSLPPLSWPALMMVISFVRAKV